MGRDDRRNTDALTTGRARRAMSVGTLTTQVGGNYLWSALKRPFQSADDRSRELLDTHLKNAMLKITKRFGRFDAHSGLVMIRKERPGAAWEVLSQRVHISDGGKCASIAI